MDNSLLIALFITAVGMTLLFLALALFYGLLSLMTAAFQDRSAAAHPPAETAERDSAASASSVTASLRAAAIAVALARAGVEQEASPSRAVAPEVESPGAETSPWWALHHQRRLAANPNARRAQ